MKNVPILLLVIIFSFITACKPGYYPCEAPQVSVDTIRAVFEGETLNLKSTGSAGSTFEWSGPNGFSSAEQNPVISNISLDGEGVYKVTAKKEACITSAKFELKVLRKPPCTRTNNTLLFGTTDHTLDNISTKYNTFDGRYEIKAKIANSQGGEIVFSFPGSFLKNGTFHYYLKLYPSNYTEASIKYTDGYYNGSWAGSAGTIYVKMMNDKPSITLCNVDFYQSVWGNPYYTKVSGKVTLP